MRGDKPGDDVSYQWALRALGAYLDERGAIGISVIETPHGLAVRYLRSPEDRTLVYEHLSTEDLMQFRRRLEERRERVQSGSPPPPATGIWATANSAGATSGLESYQDFLRALGWELDDMSAYSIVIDEQDEGMLVSYMCFDPSEGYVWHKRMANLGEGDKRALLSEAYARRRARATARRDVGELVKLLG